MQTLKHTMLRVAALGLGLIGASAVMAHDRGHDGAAYYVYPTQWERQPVVTQYSYARVVDVDPIVTRVAVNSPDRDCWVEQQVYSQPRSATPTVLGAIIGGVIGHQFGSGPSRGVATTAGAVLGASIGQDAAARDSVTTSRDVQHCREYVRQDWEERIDGYRVTYVYQGREYNTVMAYDPGNRVKVRVGVDVDVVR